jgi:hypothetical protein
MVNQISHNTSHIITHMVRVMGNIMEVVTIQPMEEAGEHLMCKRARGRTRDALAQVYDTVLVLLPDIDVNIELSFSNKLISLINQQAAVGA